MDIGIIYIGIFVAANKLLSNPYVKDVETMCASGFKITLCPS